MPEIVVASTTDAQKDIDEVAGIQAEPEPKDEAAEPVEGKAEVEGDEEQQPEKAEKHGKSGFQKRIDKLTREKYEAQQRLKAMEDRLAKLETGQTPTQQQAVEEVKEAPKPKSDDYDTYEEFVEAVADWKADQKLAQKLAEADEKERLEAIQRAQKEEQDTYIAKVQKDGEKYEDFEEVIMRADAKIGTVIPQAMQDAFKQLENPGDVLYFLAKNPDLTKKVVAMHPMKLAMELQRISAQLIPIETEEQSSASPARPVSQAPPPTRPLRGSSTRSTVPMDELDYAEYRKIRDKQEKDRFRR